MKPCDFHRSHGLESRFSIHSSDELKQWSIHYSVFIFDHGLPDWERSDIRGVLKARVPTSFSTCHSLDTWPLHHIRRVLRFSKGLNTSFRTSMLINSEENNSAKVLGTKSCHWPNNREAASRAWFRLGIHTVNILAEQPASNSTTDYTKTTCIAFDPYKKIKIQSRNHFTTIRSSLKILAIVKFQ